MNNDKKDKPTEDRVREIVREEIDKNDKDKEKLRQLAKDFLDSISDLPVTKIENA
jgi:hypothetical protein